MTGEQGPPDEYYVPLIEYDSDDPEFVRGAEVGELETRLELLRDEVVTMLIRRNNEEMLRRIAHAYGREYTVVIMDEDWMEVTLQPPTMPNVMDAFEHDSE